MYYLEAVKEYMDYCQRQRKLSKNTIKSYGTVLRKFGEWLEREFSINLLEEVDRNCIRAYLRRLNDEFAPATARHHFNVVGALFSYMEEMEVIDNSPFRKVKARIKMPKRLPNTLSLEDVQKILTAAYTYQWSSDSARSKMLYYRDCCVLEFLFDTGMRIQELCDLRIENFDRCTGTLQVFGKGNKERKCYITQQAVLDVYDQYMDWRKYYMKQLGRSHHFIFINKDGVQLSTQAARLMLEKYVKISGINKKVTPHVFRHTFASLLLEEGVDLKHIQEYLGHSTIATTQIYLHISEDNAREVLRTKHPRSALMVENFKAPPEF